MNSKSSHIHSTDPSMPIANRSAVRGVRWTALTAVVLGASMAMANCGGKSVSSKLSSSDLLRLSFPAGPPPGAKIALNRRINLDRGPGLEIVARIDHGNSQRLVFLKREAAKGAGSDKGKLPGPWKLWRKVDFVLNEPGPYAFKKGKGWVVSKEPGAKPGAIRKLLLGGIGKKAPFTSVIVEYLYKRPGSKSISSQLLVFQEGRRAFDSLTALKKHPLMKNAKRVPYEFAGGALILFPTNEGFQGELRSNGRELLLWYPGNPLPYYLGAHLTPSGGGNYQVEVELRNQGGYALVSYISVSFPNGDSIKPGKKGKLYKPGRRLFAKAGGLTGARYPLLEVTKQAWRPYFREKVRFQWTPGGKKELYMLIRLVLRRGGDKILSPEEVGTAPTVLDQQGYRAYAIKLKL